MRYNEVAEATLGSGLLEALSGPDEWRLRPGGCRGPAGGAEEPMSWGGGAAGC